MISSQYGWTDDQIMDLSLARFNQIVSSIRVRRYIERREENTRTSWMTRLLASYIAAGYMVEGDNPALESAGKIAIDEIEEILLGVEEAKEWKPGDPAIVKEPKPGSFEKLMGAMSPKR